jgi:hypothetical protein
MNPYKSYSELLFTCVDGPQAEVVEVVLAGLNEPDEWTHPETRFHAKEIHHDITLAYVDKAERDSTVPHRVVFWEPRNCPGCTVFMGHHSDGMSHSVFRLSEDSPRQWINVRIYESKQDPYPAYFFSYFAKHRAIRREIAACKDDRGWAFFEKGPVQPFENTNYYAARLKKDRLTRAIITEYMEKLGFMIRDDDFWTTDCPTHFLWLQRAGQPLIEPGPNKAQEPIDPAHEPPKNRAF